MKNSRSEKRDPFLDPLPSTPPPPPNPQPRREFGIKYPLLLIAPGRRGREAGTEALPHPTPRRHTCFLLFVKLSFHES